MIVIGADTHKESHTVGAVDAGTGRVIADRTVRAKRRSFDDLLVWVRGVDGERVWAIEDCRHVSEALERFLLARGEQVASWRTLARIGLGEFSIEQIVELLREGAER
jgi:transposase